MNYEAQNIKARALGAIAYCDEYVHKGNPFAGWDWHFARYYFNADGGEVAYFIPDLLPHHEDGYLHIHPEPRVWGDHLFKKLVKL